MLILGHGQLQHRGRTALQRTAPLPLPPFPLPLLCPLPLHPLAPRSPVRCSQVQFVMVLMLCWQFVFSIAAAGLVFTISLNRNVIEEKLEVRTLALHTAQEQRDLIMFELREARNFVQFGEYKHYKLYWESHHRGHHEDMLRQLTAMRIPKEEQELLSEAEKVLYCALCTVLTAPSLLCSLYRYPLYCSISTLPSLLCLCTVTPPTISQGIV